MTESDLSVSGQQNVAGLEVAMDNKVLMKKVERLAHLVTNTTYLRLSQRLLQLLHDTVHRTTAAELYVHLSHNHIAITELYVHLSQPHCHHRTLCTSVTTTPPQNSMYICHTQQWQHPVELFLCTGWHKTGLLISVSAMHIQNISPVRGLTVDSSQLTFVPTPKSRDTKTRPNIKNLARSNLGIVL